MKKRFVLFVWIFILTLFIVSGFKGYQDKNDGNIRLIEPLPKSIIDYIENITEIKKIKEVEKEILQENSDYQHTHTTTHFIIHYNTVCDTEEEWLECVTHPFAQKVGNYFEYAWTKEISLGFPQPPDNKINVYVEFSLYGGYLEFNGGQISIYINSILDPDNPDLEELVGPINETYRTALDYALKFMTAHELFHAIQINYDIYDDSWIIEGTANWAGDKVYDSLNYYFEYIYVDMYQPPLKYPDVSIGDPSIEHAYSAVLLFKFVEEHYGTNGAGLECYKDCGNSNCGIDIIKLILEKTKNYDSAEAIRQALAVKGETIENAFLEYLTTNFAKDLGNSFLGGFYDYCEDEEQGYVVDQWVSGYPNQVITYSSSMSSNEHLNVPNDGVNPWATDYTEIFLANDIGKLEIFFNGKNPPFYDFLLRILFVRGNNMEVEDINIDGNNDALFQKNNTFNFLTIITAGKDYGGSYVLGIDTYPKERIEGDVDGNCIVDIFDLAKVGLCYGEEATSNCQAADVNQDNKIDIFDLATVGLNYGKSC